MGGCQPPADYATRTTHGAMGPLRLIQARGLPGEDRARRAREGPEERAQRRVDADKEEEQVEVAAGPDDPVGGGPQDGG
eukprot:Skav232373  [mRNA]  locus=scaffold1077:65413:66961:+ [translate_table: standard]